MVPEDRCVGEMGVGGGAWAPELTAGGAGASESEAESSSSHESATGCFALGFDLLLSRVSLERPEDTEEEGMMMISVRRVKVTSAEEDEESEEEESRGIMRRGIQVKRE